MQHCLLDRARNVAHNDVACPATPLTSYLLDLARRAHQRSGRCCRRTRSVSAPARPALGYRARHLTGVGRPATLSGPALEEVARLFDAAAHVLADQIDAPVEVLSTILSHGACSAFSRASSAAVGNAAAIA